MSMIRNFGKAMAVLLLGATLAACGERVEVPPAHVGVISTKDGYQDNLISTSKFRLEPCFAYCDRLVLLDVSDQTYSEGLNIFIPTDKLNVGVEVKTTLSIDPRKTKELFNSLSPTEVDGSISTIAKATIYNTYAKQIIQAETREFLSQFSIAEISSSVERINTELGQRLQEALSARTPFIVRYAGLTNIKFPSIITDAQEQAAERREAIQQEEAQLQISRVRLERQLEEARLNRAIEKEKAETEADAQRVLAQSVDPRVLQLRELEIQMKLAERWDGTLPRMVNGEGMNFLMNIDSVTGGK